MVKMIGVSASFQNIAASYGVGMITEEDTEAIFNLGLRYAVETHVDDRAVLNDAMYVVRALTKMNNDAVKEFISRSAEDALDMCPLTMPENRMALTTLQRNSRVVIVGAPADAPQQLSDNVPSGTNILIVKGKVKGTLKKAMASAKADETIDLVVVKHLGDLVENDMSDPGAPFKARVSDILRRMSKIVQEHKKASAILFAAQMEESTKDLFTQFGARVIQWNESFGPEVFYGKEDAEARKAEVVKNLEQQQAAAKDAMDQATAEQAAPELKLAGGPPKAEEGNIIVPG